MGKVKTQGAIRVYGVPLPETNPIYRSAKKVAALYAVRSIANI